MQKVGGEVVSLSSICHLGCGVSFFFGVSDDLQFACQNHKTVSTQIGNVFFNFYADGHVFFEQTHFFAVVGEVEVHVAVGEDVLEDGYVGGEFAPEGNAAEELFAYEAVDFGFGHFRQFYKTQKYRQLRLRRGD